MTAPALHNQHRTQVAFYFEATPGAVPADASAWATAEGAGDAFRMFVEEGDPSYIVGDSAVMNADMQTRVFGVQAPHKGLSTADGGTLRSRLWGTGDSYTDDTQVLGGTHSPLGSLLKHALGGGQLGHHTFVTAVTGLVLTLDSATNAAVGQIICIEDADDPGRLFPVQIKALAGSDATIDRALPFNIAINDKVYGTEMAYPEQAALTNPLDADFSTLSILYTKGPHVWMAGGAHLELTEMAFERGQQPKLTWGILAARGYPQGAGAPTVPAFAEPIAGQSADVKAIGRDTKCFIQTRGVTTWVSETLFSAKFVPGVPVKPQETVTEADDGMPGRVGYMTEPADTILELVVSLTDGQQTRWTAGTELVVSYYQVAPVGHGWVVHIAKAHLMEAPKLMLEGTNRWVIKVRATDDDEATAEAMQAKFIASLY